MNLKKYFTILIFVFMTACGNVGTGVSNPPTNPKAQGGALTVPLFTASSNPNRSQTLVLSRSLIEKSVSKNALASCGFSDPGCTCQQVSDGISPSSLVRAALQGTAGVYGSATNSVDLIVQDFCELTEGFSNTGAGPDSRGLFATFDVTEDIAGTCTNGTDTVTLSLQSSSHGVYRNTAIDGDTPVHAPEVYASYVYDVDGVEITYQCTIFLLEDQSIATASCTDEDGNAVTQDTDFTCDFSN